MLDREATQFDELLGVPGTFSLEQHQLTVRDVQRNLPPSSLYTARPCTTGCGASRS